MGSSSGTVIHSYSSGSVTVSANVTYSVGGLVGANSGTISNSYSTGNVTCSMTGCLEVGGLVGLNLGGNITNSYSSGSVIARDVVGGLVGGSITGTVANSFWDTGTSGQATSAGGIGRNTTEMQDITTFSGAGWGIIVVANPDIRNPSYTWNIVDAVTYPFLSWEPVS